MPTILIVVGGIQMPLKESLLLRCLASGYACLLLKPLLHIAIFVTPPFLPTYLALTLSLPMMLGGQVLVASPPAWPKLPLIAMVKQ